MKSVNLVYYTTGATTYTFSASSSAQSPGTVSGTKVTWKYNYGYNSLTLNIPTILLNESTKIISVNNQSGHFSLDNNTKGYMSPGYSATDLLTAIKNCQKNGSSTLKITFSVIGNNLVSNFSTPEEAQYAAQHSLVVVKEGQFKNFNFVVNYEDYENTINGLGSFDIIPSTDKILGGESSLGLTVRITPTIDIAQGRLHFYVFPYASSGSSMYDRGLDLINPIALTKGKESTFTIAPVLFPVVDSSNPATIYPARMTIKLGEDNKGNIWLSNSPVTIKSCYTPLAIASGFYALGDDKNYFNNFTAYINNYSIPYITIDATKLSSETFISNVRTVTLYIKDSLNNITSFSLRWGKNTFVFPPIPSGQNLITYQYRLTVRDSLKGDSGMVYIPPKESENIVWNDFDVLYYVPPQIDWLELYRYYVDDTDTPDDLTDDIEIIDDEGTFGKIEGRIKATEFPSQHKNTLSMNIMLTTTDDEEFSENLPYLCYEVADFSEALTKDSEGYYTFTNSPYISPTYTSDPTSNPYQSNCTYNFILTFSDGITTLIRDLELSSAESYFSIEHNGVSIGGPVTGTVAEPTFDIYYPIKFHNTDWTFFNLESGFDADSWVKARCFGPVVNVVGRVKTSSAINTGTSVLLCNVSEEFSPANNATTAHPQDNYVQIVAGATLANWLIRINSSGNVQLFNYTGTSDTRWISFNMTYFVD